MPPGSQQQFAFRLTVPSTLPPSAHNVSFQVVVNADIPGVKDPTAKVDVKVVEASKDKTRRLPLALTCSAASPAFRVTTTSPSRRRSATCTSPVTRRRASSRRSSRWWGG